MMRRLRYRPDRRKIEAERKVARMTFTPIDLQRWPRGQVFWYFAKMAPTGYSLTVELDVTEVLRRTKKRGLKFFPVYLWLVTKHLNKQVEFKIAEKDGQVGYFDTLRAAEGGASALFGWKRGVRPRLIG